MRQVLRGLNPFGLLRLLRFVWFRLGEFRRHFAKIDYVLFVLGGSYPPLPVRRAWVQRRLMGAPPISLWELDQRFRQIADDPRPKGLILHLRGFEMPLSDLQSLRDSLLHLRARGKQVICYAQNYDNATYYIAAVADQVIMQPSGDFAVTGIFRQAYFLKEALASVGIGLDVVAISPFKSAFDQFGRSNPSPEYNAQINWLMDAQYDMLINGIADGRNISAEAVRAMINSAPLTDQPALDAKYVDFLLSEEALSTHLGAKYIVPEEQAHRKLLRKWRKRHDKGIALLHLTGTIIPGESGTPPIRLPIPFVGGPRMGDLTVVQQARALLKNNRAAAVVIQIDSGGGSAAASEAMAAAFDELAKTRPIIVYMNSVAASGGYYIATPAQWIVAQPGTITGSIGVISAKPLNGPFFEKLKVHAVNYMRGANAGITEDGEPLTDAQRAKMREGIEAVYRQFVGRVAKARHATVEAIDNIAGGRVWMGTQALKHGLIDELGSLHTALAKARHLANLPEDAPVFLVRGAKSALPPAQASNPAAALEYVHANWRALTDGHAQAFMPIEWQNRL